MKETKAVAGESQPLFLRIASRMILGGLGGSRAWETECHLVLARRPLGRVNSALQNVEELGLTALDRDTWVTSCDPLSWLGVDNVSGA